eukprot:GILI01008570.1.p1 GENE.GILI01008570.1~~GILI01008570.1.p1  ORF type:complete len:181 (+),score=32.92 GILI01008570.1:53-595(+)
MTSEAFNCAAHTWGIRGLIVHGHGRGGTMLGFPTANIEVPESSHIEEKLKDGINHVFYGWGVVEPNLDEVFPVVMSVGYNPHFKDVHKLAIEAHYLHKFEKDFYGSNVRVAVLGDLRVMGAFTTLEALIEVIKGDCDNATKLLVNQGEWKNCEFLKCEAAQGSKDLPSLVGPLNKMHSAL